MSKKNKNDPTLYGTYINNPIWRDCILVVYGPMSALAEYCKANNFDTPYRDDIAAYVNLDEFGTPTFIYLGETLDNISNVSHELLHYSMWLLGNRGVQIDLNDFAQHEQLTYLHGYCLDCVYSTQWLKYSTRKNDFIKIM